MPARSGWKLSRSEPNSGVSKVVFRLEKFEPSIRLGISGVSMGLSAYRHLPATDLAGYLRAYLRGLRVGRTDAP